MYNKIDMIKDNENVKKFYENEDSIFTCAFDKENISALKHKIFCYVNRLGIK